MFHWLRQSLRLIICCNPNQLHFRMYVIWSHIYKNFIWLRCFSPNHSCMYFWINPLDGLNERIIWIPGSSCDTYNFNHRLPWAQTSKKNLIFFWHVSLSYFNCKKFCTGWFSLQYSYFKYPRVKLPHDLGGLKDLSKFWFKS